jgi:hypothetical protein
MSSEPGTGSSLDTVRGPFKLATDRHRALAAHHGSTVDHKRADSLPTDPANRGGPWWQARSVADDAGEMLALSYQADYDGTGKLVVKAGSQGFAGISGAWFDTETLQDFARSLSIYPLPDENHPHVESGFGANPRTGATAQEHVGLEVGPVGGKGQVGIWIHLATAVWPDARPKQFYEVRLELLTTYERLRMFSNHLGRVLDGDLDEATIAAEVLI